MDISYLTPGSDEPCAKRATEYLVPPQDFLQQNSEIIYSADGGPVVAVTNIEWRIVSWLRTAAALKDPLELLKRAAVAFYIAGLGVGGGDPQNSVEGATALADLSVTGSASFNTFRRKLPKESDLLNDVTQRLALFGEEPPDPTRTLSSVRVALDRAYNVAWALRDPDPVRRQQTRATLGWIAVCGEDDPPHRPVNVPSAPFPQFTLAVASVQTRFAVASLNTPPLPQGYPSPGQQFPVPGGSDIVRSFPQDMTPFIPADDEVILFIHGHSSRIEEFGDIAPALLNAAGSKWKGYSIIAFDLPCNGYSMVDVNDSMFDHTTVAPNLPDFWCSNPIKSGLPTTPLLDYLLSFVLQFVDALDLIVPIKARIGAVMGGSLGGNLTLRVAESGPPWLKHIIAWSSASVWTTNNNDFPRCLALQPVATRMQEDEQQGLDARFRYFYAAFDGDTANIAGIITLPPQPQMWYRDGWDCKDDYIEDARLDRRETYNQFFRRWHWRVALEQLLFSHWDETVTGAQGAQPRFAAISVPTLLAAGDKDDYHWSNIYSASIKVAQAMVKTPGTAIFFLSTGHSIDNERPQLFAQQIMEFLKAPSRLTANQQLNVNDQLVSPNGKFKLVMQGDGNLVLYSRDTNTAVWASNTWNTPVTHAIMQGDGNFVCYDNNGKAYWASNTWGHSGAFVVLEDDGILAVLSGNVMPSALWAYDRLLPNEQLKVNQELLSPNGKFRLVMQADGNLLLYSLETNTAVWASNTPNTPVTHAIMQADGNFVCYDDNGKAYWSSNTWGHPNAFVVLQGDGRLVVSEMSLALLLGTVLWASAP